MEKSKEKAIKERPKYGMLQNTLYMIGQAWKLRKMVLVVAILITVTQVARNITELYVTPTILNRVENTVPLSELLWTIGSFILLLTVLQAAESYLLGIADLDRSIIRSSLENMLQQKLCTTSYPNAEDGNWISKYYQALRATRSSQEAAENIWVTLVELAKSIIALVVYLRLLTRLHMGLMMLVVFTSAVGYIVSKRISEWRYRHRDEERKCQRPLQYVAFNRAVDRKTAKDIRIFHMQPWLEEVYRTGLIAYESFFDRCGSKTIWANILDAVLAFARNGVAYAVLLGMVLREGMAASEFLLYFSAVGGFSSLVTGIVSGMLKLHEQSIDLSFFREFLDAPEQFIFEEGKELIPNPEGTYKLELKDVSFCYPEAKENLFSNLNLTIQPGEKLAIVGLNGAGKTTLVKLLCGLYDPTEGQVLLNGVDIRIYNRRDYYKMFSAVFQQFSILETSFRENVTQNMERVEDDRLEECLEKAGLLQKILGLTNGLDTHVGRAVYDDGVELSGGETQRLMLARALYKNAPIIVLDEPTAALDPIAENDIYMKYSAMTQGRTSIFISHRLASTQFCDRILFVADGRIAEEGTHESLLATGGEYAKLFEIQAQYYRKEAVKYE